MFGASNVRGLVVVGLVCLSCGGARQQILGQPVHQQVAVVVHISEEVNQADEAGGVAQLVETVEAGLKDHGMLSEVYTASDDHPPPPRIDLNVLFWSERSTTSRQLDGAAMALAPLGIVGLVIGPRNRMIVDCKVFLSADGKPSMNKRFDAGGFTISPDEAAAGSNAGSEILSALFAKNSALAAHSTSDL